MALVHRMAPNVSEEGKLDGHTNMERDIALLRTAEGGVAGCRVYGWAGAWISLGRQQEAQRDLLAPDLVPWVMRPTGGKAVLHGHDVTVGLAIPFSRTESRSVRKAYRAVVRPVVVALNGCGLAASLAEETQFAGAHSISADCFAQTSPNDIVDPRTGMKLAGCALRITSGAVLLQASIPAGPPLVNPMKLFATPQSASPQEWDPARFAAELQAALAFALA
jgi:lipoate-protein ligase A